MPRGSRSQHSSFHHLEALHLVQRITLITMKLNESIPPVEGVSPMAFRQPEGTRAQDRTAPLVLPPKTSLEVFRQFMQRIVDIVGTENATVVSSDDELQHEDYMDPSKAHDVGAGPAFNHIEVQ
jgi:hypothetical protein